MYHCTATRAEPGPNRSPNPTHADTPKPKPNLRKNQTSQEVLRDQNGHTLRDQNELILRDSLNFLIVKAWSKRRQIATICALNLVSFFASRCGARPCSWYPSRKLTTQPSGTTFGSLAKPSSAEQPPRLVFCHRANVRRESDRIWAAQDRAARHTKPPLDEHAKLTISPTDPTWEPQSDAAMTQWKRKQCSDGILFRKNVSNSGLVLGTLFAQAPMEAGTDKERDEVGQAHKQPRRRTRRTGSSTCSM